MTTPTPTPPPAPTAATDVRGPLTATGPDRALRASWAAGTCSPDDVARSPWHPDNPARGHCDITALVVHDLFGGSLVVGEVHHDGERAGHHWWNRLASGIELDLTREQFRLGQTVSTPRAVERPPGRVRHRQAECEVLRARVRERLGLPPAG
ncbi:hypothetical protein V2S66_24780 [Streptomyces sp. V4-01]|uniref:Uncharacterized protein n=1 Tax=Actinacidiphila polyblastidii TaxID=3110430 RepID=A0ABU7PHD0_9ACTN|nr:hypothetical protein [Streptomyces sp. V4-01]